MYNTTKQAGGYALQAGVAPLGTINSAMGNPNQTALGAARDQLLDMKTPSPGEIKYRATQGRLQQQEDRRRQKKPPTILEKLLP